MNLRDKSERPLPAGEKVSVSAILLKVYSQTNYATHKVKHPNLTITRVYLYRNWGVPSEYIKHRGKRDDNTFQLE